MKIGRANIQEPGMKRRSVWLDQIQQKMGFERNLQAFILSQGKKHRYGGLEDVFLSY
jgi:hypothetical protein